MAMIFTEIVIFLLINADNPCILCQDKNAGKHPMVCFYLL